MNKTCRYLVAGLALSALTWSSAGRAADALTVEDAWVREAPPHAEMSAAYLTIKNETSQDHTLVGVSSPQFQKVEIHSTRMMNGMVHMQMMKEVAIAPHADATLASAQGRRKGRADTEIQRCPANHGSGSDTQCR
jgi:copper(I)-binding protein